MLRAAVEGLPGTWYVHAHDLPVLERLRAGEWEPRTTLLSPLRRVLRLEALYAEPGAPAAGRAIRGALEELAAFVGAEAVEYPAEVPRRWARSLRS